MLAVEEVEDPQQGQLPRTPASSPPIERYSRAGRTAARTWVEITAAAFEGVHDRDIGAERAFQRLGLDEIQVVRRNVAL